MMGGAVAGRCLLLRARLSAESHEAGADQDEQRSEAEDRRAFHARVRQLFREDHAQLSRPVALLTSTCFVVEGVASLCDKLFVCGRPSPTRRSLRWTKDKLTMTDASGAGWTVRAHFVVTR
jgi:hypothetical protein